MTDQSKERVAKNPTNDVIFVAERRRREESANFARASVGLEGFKLTEEDETLTRRFVCGEIELENTRSLMTPSDYANASADERERIEGRLTYWRILELDHDHVLGNFDATHLREVNRRIFQDLPSSGFADVTPGEYRPPVPDGKDWMKNRVLSTVAVSYFVAYSRMDEVAQTRLEKALTGAKPEKLRGLRTHEFTASLAKLYAELDYVHPFSDGNSRTLRTFTRQLARECGYELEWETFYANDTGRDILYIARDRSVNELAKPHVQHEQTMRKIVHGMDRLDCNRDLADLLRDVVRNRRIWPKGIAERLPGF